MPSKNTLTVNPTDDFSWQVTAAEAVLADQDNPTHRMGFISASVFVATYLFDLTGVGEGDLIHEVRFSVTGTAATSGLPTRSAALLLGDNVNASATRSTSNPKTVAGILAGTGFTAHSMTDARLVAAPAGLTTALQNLVNRAGWGTGSKLVWLYMLRQGFTVGKESESVTLATSRSVTHAVPELRVVYETNGATAGTGLSTHTARIERTTQNSTSNANEHIIVDDDGPIGELITDRMSTFTYPHSTTLDPGQRINAAVGTETYAAGIPTAINAQAFTGPYVYNVRLDTTTSSAAANTDAGWTLGDVTKVSSLQYPATPELPRVPLDFLRVPNDLDVTHVRLFVEQSNEFDTGTPGGTGKPTIKLRWPVSNVEGSTAVDQSSYNPSRTGVATSTVQQTGLVKFAKGGRPWQAAQQWTSPTRIATVTTAEWASSTDAVVTGAPGSIQAGDLLAIYMDRAGADPDSVPTGWRRAGGSILAVAEQWFVKAATGSEPADYTFTYPTAQTGHALFLVIRGADTDTVTAIQPVHVSVAQAFGLAGGFANPSSYAYARSPSDLGATAGNMTRDVIHEGDAYYETTGASFGAWLPLADSKLLALVAQPARTDGTITGTTDLSLRDEDDTPILTDSPTITSDGNYVKNWSLPHATTFGIWEAATSVTWTPDPVAGPYLAAFDVPLVVSSLIPYVYESDDTALTRYDDGANGTRVNRGAPIRPTVTLFNNGKDRSVVTIEAAFGAALGTTTLNTYNAGEAYPSSIPTLSQAAAVATYAGTVGGTGGAGALNVPVICGVLNYECDSLDLAATLTLFSHLQIQAADFGTLDAFDSTLDALERSAIALGLVTARVVNVRAEGLASVPLTHSLRDTAQVRSNQFSVNASSGVIAGAEAASVRRGWLTVLQQWDRGIPLGSWTHTYSTNGAYRGNTGNGSRVLTLTTPAGGGGGTFLLITDD